MTPFDNAGIRGRSEKRVDSGHLWMWKPQDLQMDGTGRVRAREKQKNDTKGFGLSNWEAGVASC